VIELLAATSRQLGVSEIAASLGMDKGNTHRLLGVLVDRGYIRKDEHTRRYETTPWLVALSGSVLRNLDLATTAAPVCDALLADIGESVHVAQVTQRTVIYILQRRAAMRVSVNTDIGEQAPLHCTATGKAVLAQLPEATVREWVSEPFEQFTRRTPTSMDRLLEDLDLVRQRGYAIDDEELTADVRCVAAPIFAIDGSVRGCIGISGPAHRLGVSQMVEAASAVVTAAREVTNRLGGPVESYGNTAASGA
jgi:DNA-binding IclR family transcriptional regulator